MLQGLLPIGSVVLLKESTKRVMIIGLCQREIVDSGEGKMWDYAGVVFPEGYMGPNRTFMFNGDQIDRLYVLGYQDEEQIAMLEKANTFWAKMREENPVEQKDSAPEV